MNEHFCRQPDSLFLTRGGQTWHLSFPLALSAQSEHLAPEHQEKDLCLQKDWETECLAALCKTHSFGTVLIQSLVGFGFNKELGLGESMLPTPRYEEHFAKVGEANVSNRSYVRVFKEFWCYWKCQQVETLFVVTDNCGVGYKSIIAMVQHSGSKIFHDG